MHEIICPHCHKAFKIDEAGYANILKQVRDGDFEHQLHERLELAEKDKLTAVELAKARLASELQGAAAAKDTEIQSLKAQVDAGVTARKLAVAEALSTVEKERDALANQLVQAQRDKEATARLAEVTMLAELQQSAARKDAEIQALKAQLDTTALNQRLALADALGTVEKDATNSRPAWREPRLKRSSRKNRLRTNTKRRSKTATKPSNACAT